MQKNLRNFIIALELLGILLLAIHVYNKKIQTLKATSVHPIAKADMEFSPTTELKHFYEPKPNAQLINIPAWAATSSINTINADTLNERYDYSVEKPPGTYRIITLGDSMTFGLYLNTKDNYSERLEDLLNQKLSCANIKKFEVLNLGVSGYDIKYTVERFKKRGLKYDPDLVIWYLIDRNFTDPVELFADEYDYYNNADPNASVVDKTYKAAREMYKKNNGSDIVNTEDISLQSIRQYFSKKLVIFSSPTLLVNRLQGLVKNFSETDSNIFFNINIGNPTKPENTVMSGDVHPSIKGSKLIAQNLLSYLEQENIISCFRP